MRKFIFGMIGIIVIIYFIIRTQPPILQIAQETNSSREGVYITVSQSPIYQAIKQEINLPRKGFYMRAKRLVDSFTSCNANEDKVEDKNIGFLCYQKCNHGFKEVGIGCSAL